MLIVRLGAALAVSATATATTAVAQQCSGEPTRINVVMEELRSARGNVVVEIYPDDPKLFLVPLSQVNSIHVKLDSTRPTVCLPVPAPGGFAVAVFHDENADRKFNRNFLGLPTEGFGLSNNPPVRLSMPSFQSVRFQAGEGETTVRVRMRYVTGGSAPR